MDPIPNGLNPEWTEPRMYRTPNGPNLEWTELRIDSTPTGLNSEWDSSSTFLSTSNGVQCQCVHQKNGFKKRSGMNLSRGWDPVGTRPRLKLKSEWDSTSTFLSTPRMVYNVKVYVYQKNGFKKKKSISVKKGYQGLNIHEFSYMLKKLETMKNVLYCNNWNCPVRGW